MNKAIIVAVIGLIGSVLAALISANATANAQIDKERQRMSGGTISADGQIKTRIGRTFSVLSQPAGDTRITFDQSFARPPSVTMTPYAVSNEIVIPKIVSVDERSVHIKTESWRNGGLLPCEFSFMVLEGTP